MVTCTSTPRRECFSFRQLHCLRVVIAVVLPAMPVTRASSRNNSNPPSNQPYATRRAGPSGSGDTKKPSKPPSNEIIVLSSDDDEPPPKGTVASKKSPSHSKKKVAPPVNLSDVLEISSEDESPKKPSVRRQARSSEATNKELQRTIRKLREVRLAVCPLLWPETAPF